MAKSRAGRGTRPSTADRRALIVLAVLACGWGTTDVGATASTTITTVAGGGSATGNDVPAPEASLNFPNGVEPAANGFFVAEQSGHRVRRVSSAAGLAPDTGTIATFAGTGAFGGGSPVLNGSPTAVPLRLPCCISPTAGGGLLIADTFGGMVHRVSGTRLDTVAGTGAPSSCPSSPPSGVPALTAQLCFVVGVGAHATDDRFLVAEDGLPDQDRTGGARVYEVDAAGALRIVAGGGCPSPPANPLPLQICLANPRGPAYTGSGSPTEFIVADRSRHVVWKISSTNPATAAATRIAGTGVPTSSDLSNLGDGGPAGAATLGGPSDLAMTPSGGYLIADRNNCRVRRVGGLAAADPIETAVGIGCSESAPPGDGGPAAAASLRQPQGVAFSPAGVLVSDTGRGLVRLVDRTTITGGTSGTLRSATATFDFEGSEPAPTFRCAIDDQEVASLCSSPKTYTGLPDGAHTFKVYDATVPADPSPATRTWTVDTTAPQSFRLLRPVEGAVDQPPRPVFEWEQADDATTGVARYELWVDGKKLQELADAHCEEGVCRVESAAQLTEAFHSWEVRAIDGAGLQRVSETRLVYVGSPPVARLALAPNPVLVESPVVLDASASTDPDGPLARFEWDTDGDGEFDRDSGPSPRTTMTYPVPGSVTVTVRVTDKVGRSAIASGELRIGQPPDSPETFGVSINGGAAFTRVTDVSLKAVYPRGTTAVLVANDGGFLAATPFLPAAELPWKLRSSGPERLPRTVYVRFRSGPFVSETYTDDIVLDETAPELTSARLVNPTSTGAARVGVTASRTRRRYVLRARATDDVSGVGRMQVSSDRRRPGRLRPFRKALAVLSSKPYVYVRVRDRAGNYSRWRVARAAKPARHFGPS